MATKNNITTTKPEDDCVSIFVPTDNGDMGPIEGSYNGENWRVPRNKWVAVKKPIAKIIEHSYAIMRSIEEAPKEFNLTNHE
jgi:hypothetical protein